MLHVKISAEEANFFQSPLLPKVYTPGAPEGIYTLHMHHLSFHLSLCQVIWALFQWGKGFAPQKGVQDWTARLEVSFHYLTPLSQPG